jgi:hypothetical protein
MSIPPKRIDISLRGHPTTMIELLLVIGGMGIGATIGMAVGKRPFCMFAILGLGFLAGLGLRYIYLEIEDYRLTKNPIIPPCQKGKCKQEDYTLKRIKEGIECTCLCGNTYLFKKDDIPLGAETFDEVLADGSLRPYMHRKSDFDSWKRK